MKILSLIVALILAATGYVGLAAADPWKDESGHGRWGGHYEHSGRYWREARPYHDYRYEKRAYKEEYRMGGCKIERKWDGGEYKEEIKCKHGWRPSYIYRY